MRFAQILMQHNPMYNRATAVHPVHHQKSQPRNVPRLHHLTANQEQQDKGDTDAAHISGKTFRLVPGTEIIETEKCTPNPQPK